MADDDASSSSSAIRRRTATATAAVGDPLKSPDSSQEQSVQHNYLPPLLLPLPLHQTTSDFPLLRKFFQGAGASSGGDYFQGDDDDDDDELEEGLGLTLPATPVLDSLDVDEVDPLTLIINPYILSDDQDSEDDSDSVKMFPSSTASSSSQQQSSKKRNNVLQCGTPPSEDLDSDSDSDDFHCLPKKHTQAVEQLATKLKVWAAAGWNCCHFRALPNWLQDNDFLVRGHRPPLPCVKECFKSIFRIHTETMNIWTHLLGCLAFFGVAIYFLTRPSVEIQLQEKLVFTAFFIGAIACLGLSAAFHTLHCHSEFVGKLFSKLDYVGIALLIMGSFFPWLYYGFYCEKSLQIFYLSVTFVLGLAAIVVSLWDKFGEPRLRPLRAGLFAGFGLSGVIPAIHYALAKGWFHAISKASLGWLILMGVLYVLGAVVYASRIPERWFPGRCDIWGHSHQLFHLLVIAAAFVHYHGISEMAMHRLAYGECEDHDQQSSHKEIVFY